MISHQASLLSIKQSLAFCPTHWFYLGEGRGGRGGGRGEGGGVGGGGGEGGGREGGGEEKEGNQ